MTDTQKVIEEMREPVAWMRGDEVRIDHCYWSNERATDAGWAPLYTHPPADAGMAMVKDRLPTAYRQVLVLSDGSDKYNDASYSHEWNLGSVDANGDWSFKGVTAHGYKIRGWIELPMIAAAGKPD